MGASLVDEAPFIRQVLRDNPEGGGFHVATATNGTGAFRAVPQFNPEKEGSEPLQL